MLEQPFGRPLLERFPGLASGLPLLPLATLPTPLRSLDALAASVGGASLWLKDDAAIHPVYGGNKVRKLELLLADAKSRGARRVMTFGYAGSNHATATAVHAASLGLRSISMLLPQQNAPYLRKNLLVSASVGAEVHEYASQAALAADALRILLRCRIEDGVLPAIVPPGGSSPLGTVGFVNAAFELASQLQSRGLPMPSRLYAAAGSLGTVVGLGIGLAVLGLATRIVAVRVVDERFVSPSRARTLWRRTVALLQSKDASFPDPGDPGERIEMRGECYGGGYAVETPAAREAGALASELEGLSLDVTYTAKTMACLLADARRGLLDGPTIFWNTCNSSPLETLAAKAGPKDLPRRLQHYFLAE